MRWRGVVTVLVALALLLIAATIKSGWLYLVASALAALVVVGVAGGRAAVRRLSLERSSPAEVFEGERLRVTLSVTNDGRLAAPLVKVTDLQAEPVRRRGAIEGLRARRERYREQLGGGRESGDSTRPAKRTGTVAFERIERRERASASYELAAPRRGSYPTTELELEAGGLFGSARWRRRVTVRDPLLVFPSVHSIEWFPLEKRTAEATSESFEWSRKGVGQDYFGVREYASGDSLRHVHWKSSARLGRLIVREYQQEFRPEAGLVVALATPTTDDPHLNSLEDGLRAAASIAAYLHGAGIPPWLVVRQDGKLRRLEPGSLYESMRPLAMYRPPEGSRDPARLTEALRFAGDSATPGTSLVVVTNLDAGPALRELAGVNGGRTVTAVLVLEESYGGDPDGERARARTGELCEMAGRNLNLLTVASGMELSSCLSEPLTTIA